MVVSDYAMPFLNGVAFHAAVRALDAAQAERFLFITGGPSSANGHAPLHQLGLPIMDKPFSVDGLKSAIAAVMARHRA